MTTASSALLARSANFREVLELHPCDAVPSLVLLRVISWYADAKDPNAPQVRYQTMVPRRALNGVKVAVDAVLLQGDHVCG